MRPLLLSILIGAAVGCNSTGLPYTPQGDGLKIPVSASHQLTSDRLYVHVATDGWRVESASLTRADGAVLAPARMHHPPRSVGQRAPVGTRIGVGAGVGSLGRGSGVGVSVGAGAGTNYGHTVVVFASDQVGPGPWALRVKLADFPEVTIELPAVAVTGE